LSGPDLRSARHELLSIAIRRRIYAGELGRSNKDLVGNVITAPNMNYIRPQLLARPQERNDYYLTAQLFEHGHKAIHNNARLGTKFLMAAGIRTSTTKLRDLSSGGEMNCGPIGGPQCGTGRASSRLAERSQAHTVLTGFDTNYLQRELRV